MIDSAVSGKVTCICTFLSFLTDIFYSTLVKSTGSTIRDIGALVQVAGTTWNAKCAQNWREK